MQDYNKINIIFLKAGKIVNDSDKLNQYLEKEWELQKKKLEEEE